ncbi:HMG box transcription factor BBX-like isoform X6 [Vespa mandarinia]|uniref:HMG box transcription factor BBX-like isoform X6 n=1 Tax=Vespa mandarinia TaxID=7446 RepID=UPI001607EA5E|nr:HMG box transcription factor BBX-like isoform X6 [Vespa mandarinia]
MLYLLLQRRKGHLRIRIIQCVFEPKDLREPAHHARRPMNAFLIFCKRHRGSVRSGFPHLENRAVTRVLGEWWATLNPDQKRTYKNLAQEYKDAFLKANPDFKWYKLPAPPLRTLTTRPTNKKQEIGTVDQATESVKSEYVSSDYINSDNKDGQAIQPGKLADESQIGGLSSLFTPQKVQLTEEQITTHNDVPEKEVTAPKPPKKRNPELLLALEHKNECKVDLFNEKKRKHSESNNNEQHTMHIENEKHVTNSFLDSNANSEENNYRGERTCKGLRYQKFLAEQIRHIGPSGQNNKRKKSTTSYSPEERINERRNSISSNISEKTDSLSSEGGNSSRGELEHLVESAEGNMEASKPEETETEGAESEVDFGPWTTRKRFRAEDFNLEKKIEALPSLSLEEFQEKKKQQRINKKKVLQKLNTNKWCHGNSNSGQNNRQNNKNGLHTTNEIPEDGEKSLLVGSQKRKARKQSITRNAAATTTTSNMSGNQESNKTWCASPDLEALACLAAVAANRTKLTKNNA